MIENHLTMHPFFKNQPHEQTSYIDRHTHTHPNVIDELINEQSTDRNHNIHSVLYPY